VRPVLAAVAGAPGLGGITGAQELALPGVELTAGRAVLALRAEERPLWLATVQLVNERFLAVRLGLLEHGLALRLGRLEHGHGAGAAVRSAAGRA